MEVGDEGMELGDREPKKCCDALLVVLPGERAVREVICFKSLAAEICE